MKDCTYGRNPRFRESGRCWLRFCLCLALLLGCATGISAQGGPPFITDDPGTPGTNHWEINVGTIFNTNTSPGQSSYEAPHVDLNYGLGPRIQLKFEAGLAIQTFAQSSTTAGVSNSLAGVKWRIFDEDKYGFSLSTYPQFEFNNPTSSVRHGIAEDGKQFFLPLELARKFGPFETDVEGGYLFRTRNPGAWEYGGLLGHTFKEKLEIFGELHGTLVRQNTGNELLADIGGRLHTSKHTTLLFMTGHSVHRIPNESPTWFGYFGIQLTM